MRRTTLLACILAFSFLGVADAWYLAQSALTDTALVCGVDVIDGCNTVAQSGYSRILGVPLGVYGVLFYSLTFILAAVLGVVSRRLAYSLLLILASIGLLFSLYFLGLQVFVIQALCIYCLLSVLLSICIFLFSHRLWKRYAPPRMLSS